MGCSGSRTTDDYEHNLQDGFAYDKSELLSLTMNPNIYITQNQNYYKDQRPSSNFKDDIFPPDNSSFFGKDESKSRVQKMKSQLTINENDITWKHIREIYPNGKIFNEKISKDDIDKGEIKNDYLLTSFSILSEFPRLILELFKTVNLPNDDNPIEIGMKIDGEWKIICIDDMIPVNKNSNKPIFINTNNDSLWGILLEKAWAKINGGYCNIIIGYPREIFESLTPFATLPINALRENKNSLWKNIKECERYQCIFTATVNDKKDNFEQFNLMSGHTVSLISSDEKEVNEEKVKLIKLKNHFKFCEWNGDWSNDSDKWDYDDAREKFNKSENDKEKGIFWIDYDNFCQYFSNVCICVPLNPINCSNIKINKDISDKFNVIKIKIPKSKKDKFIINFCIYSPSYRFNREIQNDKIPHSNLILAKISGSKFIYCDSSFDESISTSLEKGEYVLLCHVSYNLYNIEPKDYIVSISTSESVDYFLMEPDYDLSLLKSIIYTKVEDMKKYKPRFKNKIVLFTGNRFENSGISFLYIQNKTGDNLFFKPNIYFKNILPIEGELRTLSLPKNGKFLYLGIRDKNDEIYQAGGSGKVLETELEDSFEPPEINESNLKNYKDADYYQNMDVCFQFNQNL
jgi:hypothetical protein